MSKETYNNQSITEYLLASLSEQETERFDELSITNDDFAESLKAAEKDLIDAYVQGELTGAQLERFEFHYLASPLRRERVQFAQAFQLVAERKALARAAPEQSKDVAEPRTTRISSWFPTLSFLTAPRLGLQWGFAALALAVLTAGAWLMVENARLRNQISQTQAKQEALVRREQELQKELDIRSSEKAETEPELTQQVSEEQRRLEAGLRKELAGQRVDNQKPPRPDVGSIAALILTPQLRGVDQIPTVSIQSGTVSVAVRMQLEPNEYAAYRVRLLAHSSNETLWRSGMLKARATGDEKLLDINLPARLLRSQTYVLQVSGVPTNGKAEDINAYPFKVVKQ